MAFTTHEKIRVEAGFQNRFVREAFQLGPTADGATAFYVRTDDNIKFVPEFNTGNTIAGISDVKVWCGLSGIQGISQMVVTSIDQNSGQVILNTAPTSGSSLTITYSSSAVGSQDIENIRSQAESIINRRLALCYDLPLSPVPSCIIDLASRLSAAMLLIRNYGGGARDTSQDGWKLYQQLMGLAQIPAVTRESSSTLMDVGEIGLICTTNYQLVDDNGNVIVRNDGSSTDSTDYKSGGRVVGRIYDITEEQFRFKKPQVDADTRQGGSGLNDLRPTQG